MTETSQPRQPGERSTNKAAPAKKPAPAVPEAVAEAPAKVTPAKTTKEQ